MSTLAPQNTFSYLLDQGFRRANKYHMLPFQLLVDRFWLRAKVGRNRLTRSDWSFPYLDRVETGPIAYEFEPHYWVEYSSETSAIAASFCIVSPEAIEEWRRWQWLTEFHFAQWREIFAVVKLNTRLLTRALQLLLTTLSRPFFADHLSRKEYIWMLLYGAHPPRQDAGIFPPAFAYLWEGTLRISPAIL